MTFWLPWHNRKLHKAPSDLQRQLQQAQEERDELSETLILIRGRELEAISRWRGEDVQRYLKQPDYGELLDWLNGERIQAIERAKAAEEKLAEQRVHPCYCCQDSCRPGCDCYTTIPRDNSGNTVTYEAPAEAQEEANSETG